MSIRRVNSLLVVATLVAASTAGVACTGGRTLHVYPTHTVMFNEDGDPIRPEGEEAVRTAAKEGLARRVSRLQSFPLETDYSGRLDRIFAALRDSGKRKLLIYLHGGLNTAVGSLVRIDSLLCCPQINDGSCTPSCCPLDGSTPLFPMCAQEGNLWEQGGVSPLYEESFPVFINWRSSGWSSVRDHLFKVRQGKTHRFRAIVTSPLYVVGDLGEGIATGPVVLSELYADRNEDESDIWISLLSTYERNGLGPNLELGGDCRGRWERRSQDYFQFIPFGFLKPIPIVLIDGFGEPAWRVMNRRITQLFHRDPGFSGDEAYLDGALAEFFRRLVEYQREDSDLKVVVIGHSMGAILLNKALRSFPELRVDRIVYMASAATLLDYEETLFGGICDTGQSCTGYLDRHAEARVYHLTLQEDAEIKEKRWGWFEVVPRGSLLDWIDNFLADPDTPLHRTAGRIINLHPESQRTPERFRDRIFIRSFDFGRSVAKVAPQEHGDFGDFVFWDESFWHPDPWRYGRTPQLDDDCPPEE